MYYVYYVYMLYFLRVLWTFSSDEQRLPASDFMVPLPNLQVPVDFVYPKLVQSAAASKHLRAHCPSVAESGTDLGPNKHSSANLNSSDSRCGNPLIAYNPKSIIMKQPDIWA